MKIGPTAAACIVNYSRLGREFRESAPLGADQELALCHRWREHHDIAAADRLARMHGPLVADISCAYRGLGLSAEDLTGEGQLGLMRAICRFDPDRGMTFATYAACCVRSAIHERILQEWSHIQTAVPAARQKLSFSRLCGGPRSHATHEPPQIPSPLHFSGR